MCAPARPVSAPSLPGAARRTPTPAPWESEDSRHRLMHERDARRHEQAVAAHERAARMQVEHAEHERAAAERDRGDGSG